MRILVPVFVFGLTLSAFAQDIKPPSAMAEELTPMQEEELVPRSKKQEFDDKDIPEPETEKDSSGYTPLQAERPSRTFDADARCLCGAGCASLGASGSS